MVGILVSFWKTPIFRGELLVFLECIPFLAMQSKRKSHRPLKKRRHIYGRGYGLLVPRMVGNPPGRRQIELIILNCPDWTFWFRGLRHVFWYQKMERLLGVSRRNPELDQNLKHHTFLKIDAFSLKTCMQASERATWGKNGSSESCILASFSRGDDQSIRWFPWYSAAVTFFLRNIKKPSSFMPPIDVYGCFQK